MSMSDTETSTMTTRRSIQLGIDYHKVRVIADGRAESDSCEAGTPGCCIDHTVDDGTCETW